MTAINDQGGDGVIGMPGTDGFANWLRRSMDICPNCLTELPPRTCCFSYSTWSCRGCGATLDSRVVSPKVVLRCENSWPDYDRHFGDLVHPLVCSCTGRGWYEPVDNGCAETPPKSDENGRSEP